MRICGTLLRNQRIVIFGAGVAGIGIADLLRDVMIDAGLRRKKPHGGFGAWTCMGCSPPIWGIGCRITRQLMPVPQPRSLPGAEGGPTISLGGDHSPRTAFHAHWNLGSRRALSRRRW